MSIGDKLTTIANNAQTVNELNEWLEYRLDAQNTRRTLQKNVNLLDLYMGHLENTFANYGIAWVKGAPLGAFADGIDEVYTKGAKSEYDKFWDGVQNYGNRKRYTYAFDSWAGVEHINPKYIVKPTTASPYMFNGCTNLKSVDKSKFDFSVMPENYTEYNQGLYALFNKCTNLVSVDLDFVPTMSYSYFFTGCTSLKTVKTIRVNENSKFGGTAGGDCFSGCSALEDVVFEGVIANNLAMTACQNLNYRTLDNISRCLKNFVAEGSTERRTLALHSNAKAKLSDAEKLAITQKGWTLA